MPTNLIWKKGLFSNTYSIHSRGVQTGTLTERPFSRSSQGQLNDKRYTFRTIGTFKQRTQILDREKDSVIGEINYNSMMTRATISLERGTFNWKYENIRNTKWRIFGPDDIEIRYNGSFRGGQITSSTDDELLLLSGLFVTNYYWQMTLVIILAVFIPIWVSVIT